MIYEYTHISLASMYDIDTTFKSKKNNTQSYKTIKNVSCVFTVQSYVSA